MKLKTIRHILTVVGLLVLTPMTGMSVMSGQAADTIRYVKTTGTYQGTGRSWSQAKNNLQDAINDLYQYLQEQNLTSGSVYVAAGTYKPTESTETYGGGLQYTSFKIYPGIHVYGGFAADITDDNARPCNADGSINTTYRPLDNSLPSLESGQEAKSQPWIFVNKTILTGSHTSSNVTFSYDASHGYYSTLFPANSYHVVWFATEGFVPVTVAGDEQNHALPLSHPASVDGCTITDGFASNKNTSSREHTGFGGGAYMVDGATLRNCVVYHCEATMRGGGVYLDGGGLVDKCMIHTCQTQGVGIMQGYGGGVCIDYNGAVTRSYILNNSSRLGGGVAICHAPSEYPWASLDAWRVANGGSANGEINVYSPHATACIISNNTATAEGGGIYFYNGGVGNHLTITRNNCVGQDVTYYGRRHGRSGGVYILNGAQVYNSVVWGNKCGVNSDIQYATYIGGSTADVKDESGNVIQEGLKPKFYYSAIDKHDITDWAGSMQSNVMSLESSNTNETGNDAHYPYFIGSDGKGTMMGYAGAGINISLPMGTIDPEYDQEDPTSVPRGEYTGLPRPIYWKPAAISSMSKMGLQVTDALHLSSPWIQHAHTETDLFGDAYKPMSTFGALIRREEQFGCVLVKNQEIALYREQGYTQEGNVNSYNDALVPATCTVGACDANSFLPTLLPDNGAEATLPTLFVDPARNAGHQHIAIGEQGVGGTWNKPVGSINDAIHYFRKSLKRIGSISGTDTTFVYDGTSPIYYDNAGDVRYKVSVRTGGTDDSPVYTEYEYKHVQILVKGYARGSGINATTAGIDAYLGAQLRTAAIRPCSNMRIYGGYASDATGTDFSERNTRENPTVVSANVTKSGYENNSAHVLALINVRNVIIDGLRLFDGNANLNEEHSYALDENGVPEPITYGGGIILNNFTTPQAERIDMTGNIFRNGYIANCSAPDGAAVYVNSSNKKGDGSYSLAELNIMNCVIRNNTIGDGEHDITDPSFGDAGVITARGYDARIRIDHCDIVNNCGYAMETLVASDLAPTASNPDANGVNTYEGRIRIYNSVMYANGKINRANRSKLQQPLSCRSATGCQNNVDGDYIYLDWDAPKPKNPAHCFAVLCRDFSDQYHKWGVRKMDMYQQTIFEDGVSPMYFDSEADANTWISSHTSPGINYSTGTGWTWNHAQGSDSEGAIYLDYPYFDNPSRNVGHSEDGDKPMNGGVVSYMPGNQNPMTNGAADASRLLWDINNGPRTRGGDPDIGAIENTHLPLAGAVLYVTPTGAGRMDGSSWNNAIAGNTVYVLDGIAGPALAAGDKLDLDENDTPISDRVLDSEGNPILTSNPKYSGGFAKIYLSASTGNPQTTTTTKTWTTETDVYDDGPWTGKTETLQDNKLSENTVTTGSAGGATEGFVAGWYDDDRYPYGELSGASRSFWRANPWHTSTNWTVSGYNESSFIDSCKTKGWINNSRAERYVGGLQYAVEKATAYNTLAADSPTRVEGIDSVQVWVGDGKYSDYKGFVMRDKTTVMGGFPASTLGSPGLSERQALMSDVVNIPKSKAAQDLDPKDYETILQISDTDPKTDNTFNTAAVNYWDDDYSRNITITTTQYVYKKRTIVHHYTYTLTPYIDEDVTSTYIANPNFTQTNKSAKVDEGDRYSYTFGNAASGFDVWHMSYPKSCKVKDSELFSSGNSRKTYDHSTGAEITPVSSLNWLWPHDAELTGMEVWQTIPSLPSGEYHFEIDLGASYRNALTDATSLNMNLLIIDADNDTTVQPISSSGSLAGAGDNGRGVAYRYSIDFTTATTGALTIKIVVGEGMRPNPNNIADGTSSPNRRSFWLSNLKLYTIGYNEDYVLDHTDDDITDNNDVEHESSVTEDFTTYTSTNHRTTIRKRVLSMPDICVPTFGSGIIGDPAANSGFLYNGDNISHTDRVFGPSKDKRTSTTRKKHEDLHYVEYSNVYWNGFTIRHGFIRDERMAHGGGAGVNIYEGAHLQNCIVINNMSSCSAVKGAGLFCDGATSTIEGCFVLNNTSTEGKTVTQNQVFAGGMFMYEGTCFNSLFANNYSWGSAGGVGFCVGRFYNNTIAYNTCNLTESSAYSGGAISIATQSNPNLFVANSIIYGNNGRAIRERTDINNYSLVNPFINCYIQTEKTLNQDMYKRNIINWTESVKTNYGIGNILLNGEAPSAATTPFAADFDENGDYVEGRAASLNDFRLNSNFGDCINKGTEEFASNLYQALTYKGKSDSEIRDAYIYQSVSQAQLPSNDVVFADRVMDCQIDMGAYEYDGTKEIHPGYELIAFDPEEPDTLELCAVYYVAAAGRGLGSAHAPEHAACPEKLQKVLDAAGKYKMDLHLIKKGTATGRTYSTENVQVTGTVTATYEEIYMDGTTKKVRQVAQADQSLADVKHVIVKVTEGEFQPVRSTNNKMATGVSEEVKPTRSIAIPHGVEVWGGYTDGDTYDFYESTRDPLNHKTTFTGYIEGGGRAYHVITFTNDIFDINDALLEEGALSGLANYGAGPDANRSVVDGISIEYGYANGTDDEDRRGGAAVVNAYAHIRNCIIRHNEATKNGGGLFILPASLVSGCVIFNNTSELGGGIYVMEPTDEEMSVYASTEALRDLAYARIYNSTIVRNRANVRGGGLWYETNIRAKGLVLWRNSSNDMNNVAGVFDTQKELTENNYPFAYTAVQARRLPGVNNIELQTENDKGVRWTQNSMGDMRWRGDTIFYTSQSNKEAYYYIEKLSALVRAGMPYSLYKSLRLQYPTLELRDIAGVARMKELYDADDNTTFSALKHITFDPEKKDNEFIEIGARALNAPVGILFNRPFTRIYVSNPEYVNLDLANQLLNSGDPLYSQQGSSMANPFQRFSDALDYIIALRSSDITTPNGQRLKDIYRDTRFEIFIAGGSYYPTHNARGQEGHARASTFLVPEGVSILGGMSPDVYYGQAGYNYDYLQPTAGADILKTGAADSNDDFSGNDRTSVYSSTGSLIPELDGILVRARSAVIWESRQKEDLNGNNIYEPWEFYYTTTFSGNTPRGLENQDNVYHVFTCYADDERMGLLPRRYSKYYPAGTDEHAHIKFKEADLLDERSEGTECAYSTFHRMIIFNGVNITNGNARDFEDDAIVNNRNYWRGGGIFVDGDWEHGDLDSGVESVSAEGDTTYIAGYDKTNPDAPGLRNIPLMIVSSQFLNNNAIQGGGIFTNGDLNIFNSSFVQNYTQGPTSEKDQNMPSIQYTGGGAIACNSELRCTNTIFANNEAMLGDWEYRLSGSAAKGYLTQGFGGAIWGGKQSNVRLLNCNIVNNKGVSYPAVYVDHSVDARKFSANTIYWGNRASGLEPEGEAEAFKGTDETWGTIKDQMDLNKDVYSYRTAAEKDETLQLLEKREAGTITTSETERLAELERHQIMFFCSYRPTFGPTPEYSSGKIHVAAVPAFNVQEGDYDPHEVPFLGESVNYYDIFHGNNNINITFENEGVDGPNFILPSAIAGKDGYNPSANWMPSRINNLTDNGWSYVTLTSLTSTGDTEFKMIGGDGNNQNGVYPWNSDSYPENQVGGGPYNFYAYQLKYLYNLTFMPYGDQYYMSFKNTNMTDAGADNSMLRISSNPLLLKDEEKAYIDLGVYEYQHRKLRVNQMSEVDVLWVSEVENVERGNNGYTWETPTSNLQAAIETLLRSRNGHAKRVNIIEGQYKPLALLGNEGDDMSLSFTIQTRLQNNGAQTPTTGEGFGIKSLTIRGGYDRIIPNEAGYDPDKNPVVFSIAKRTSTSDDQLRHIVNIIDVEQYTTSIDGVSGVKDHVETGVAIPLTFEGITFENPLADDEVGGAAIYYQKQTKYDRSLPQGAGKGETLLAPPADYDSINHVWTSNDMPKLTLRNCTFRNCGKEGEYPSAVKIEGGAGKTFVVNTLFSDNNGNPIEAVNATLLNCTSAQNGGYIDLQETSENYGGGATDYSCTMHNSIVWKDDGLHSGGLDWRKWRIRDKSGNEIALGSSDQLTYNAYSLDSADPVGEEGDEDARHNIWISKTNSDMILGPNFVSPEEGDYHILPSNRVMNAGDDDTYARHVWSHYYVEDPDAWKEAYRALMTNNHVDQDEIEYVSTFVFVDGIYEEVSYEVFKARKDYDLGFTRRLQSSHIDRGAYECLSNGQRILYVNPNNATASDDATGKTWQDAFGSGKLQLAIDAASIYANASNKQAYVFVKGSTVSQGSIILREGVEVYGSLPSGYRFSAVPSNEDPENEDIWTYTEAEVDAFVNRVKAERSGVAASTTTPSIISGVSTIGILKHTNHALIDGFRITNEATEEEPGTIPVVNVVVPRVILRNCVITDNVMDDDVPLINMEGRGTGDGKSLLYNTLIYGNRSGVGTAGTLVNVGAGGYVLNCTVVSDQAGETPIGGTHGSSADHVKNSISVSEAGGARGAMFAPYLRTGANAYTPAAYLTSYRPYWYQLTETSAHINGGEDNGSGRAGGNTIADFFPVYVHFGQDRDLLGNPRRLGGRVDNGCYETWRITDSRYATNMTNPKDSEDEGKYVYDTGEPAEDLTEGSDYLTYKELYDAGRIIPNAEFWTNNYGGNHYPHIGSVVYVMNDANLVFDTDGGAPLFTSANNNQIRIGYLLVKPGGSVYGQGNALQFGYVSAEKAFSSGAQYGLVSMPFQYYINATVASSGSYSSLSSNFGCFRYDSDGRAAYNYEFQGSNSSLWKPFDNTVMHDASEGWLLKFNSALGAVDTLRFTGWSGAANEYVYEETVGETEKTVTLSQYDNLPQDGTAHFTTTEDMGWNLKGMPYLVSHYHTEDFRDGRFEMHIPHFLYKMDTDGKYVKNSIAYTVRSWLNEEPLNFSEGCFVQTAALGEYEDLHFRLPIYSGSALLAAPRPIIKMQNSAGEGDIMQVYPDEDADKRLTYTRGRDGVKWLLRDEPQLYMLGMNGDARMSFAGAAPTETDLPLGVSIPDITASGEDGVFELYTFSLPNKEAYEAYKYVWLIDKERNRTVNLLEKDYVTTVSGGENNTRFLLRIGGVPLWENGGRKYIVYCYNRIIHVRGLMPGDIVTIYDAAGRRLFATTASTAELSVPVAIQGGYMVRINDYGQKVVSL